MKVKAQDPSLVQRQPRGAEAQSARETAPARAAERGGSAASAPTTATASTVTFSKEVQEVQAIARAAKEEPELRSEVVEQARADLAKGSLQFDPMALAAAISRDLG